MLRKILLSVLSVIVLGYGAWATISLMRKDVHPKLPSSATADQDSDSDTPAMADELRYQQLLASALTGMAQHDYAGARKDLVRAALAADIDTTDFATLRTPRLELNSVHSRCDTLRHLVGYCQQPRSGGRLLDGNIPESIRNRLGHGH